MPLIHADVALHKNRPHIIVARPTTYVNNRVAEVLSRYGTARKVTSLFS